MKKNYELSIFYTLAVLLTLTFCQTSVFAGKGNKTNKLWQVADKSALPARQTAIPADIPVYRLNRKMLDEIFDKAPLEFSDAARITETILEIPTPDGGTMRFRIEESPLLAPDIAAQFPTWKSFVGQGIDDPTATAVFGVNDLGFHGMVLGAKGTLLIDPYSQTDKKNYIVYYKGSLGSREDFSCNLPGGDKLESHLKQLFALPAAPAAFSNGTQLRTYRIAVSATKEYTNFFGGNVTTAFSAINRTVDRLKGIYRRELAVTFTLVSGTNTVFTTANDGGFPSSSDPNVSTVSLTVNGVVLNNIIGKNNYDIGHVLSRTNNPDGVALSPSLCNGSSSSTTNPNHTRKAQGFTGAPTPDGDAFDVDYVAHEIGHQFGMSHTFNNDIDGSCKTREPDSAYEPASGVTIMGYGGICKPRNLAKSSIEYFNLRSFDQTLQYLQVTIPNSTNADLPANCGNPTANGNTVPTVTTSGNFTIPRLTPFTLTTSATDANGDALTYFWEEFDLAAANAATGSVQNPNIPGPDNDNDNPTRNNTDVDSDENGKIRPIFRAYNPTASGSRTFPALNYILDTANNEPAGSNQPSLFYTGTLPNAPTSGSTAGYVCEANEDCVRGERLPTINRTMNFRVTVRDNNAGGGSVRDALSTVTIAAGAGPFRVTTQDTATTWAGNSAQTVTWDVAGTTANGINAANVKISLSIDGGQTFPTTILASTPNDGTQSITVPNSATTQARIKIEAVGNIFFDINNANFTITASAPTTTVRSDFDGDGKTDFSVFRPSNGTWYLQRSTTGFSAFNFGLNGDVIIPGDYDGDRKTDFAVWRPSNVEGNLDFFVFRSIDNTFAGSVWGITTDIPTVADFDGDNKDDVAIWRPSNGLWCIKRAAGGEIYTTFGQTGDKPVQGDFDGDSKADLAVFRPSNSTWYVQRSTDNGLTVFQWGTSGDIPVFADYDGDNKDDFAVFRPSNGTWYISKSTGGTSFIAFGQNGDIPVPGDFDGDGRYDQAVYRSGTWYVNNSTSGFSTANFGLSTDVATPRNYLPQ